MLRRATIRVRLIILYGGLFTLAGAVLLAVMYLLVAQNLNDRLGVKAAISIQLPGTAGAPDGQFTGTASGGDGTPLPLTDPSRTFVQLSNGRRVTLADAPKALTDQQNQIRAQTLNNLLAEGGVALLVVGLVAAGFGWLMAERALRPVHDITATARRVAAAASAQRGLHERIALTGPADEIKELADTFDDMLERLDRSFDGQRRFVANASHELRTPLAINRALVEVAITREGASPDAQRLGESLLSVNARHERLIDGLLTLADSENAVTDRLPVDLGEVADHVVAGTDLAGVEVRGRDLRAATVLGDPVLLDRLTQNLVENAVRHNGSGGWLSVTTGRQDGYAVLTVANTGPVVAPYELETIFEPFRRLAGDRTAPGTRGARRTGSARGFGLGLSIVRAVARAHGGDVAAVPRDGGGLTVTVRLPAAPVAEP